MEPLYNYGISQEDVFSEYRALKIAPHDSLICIASAGEIPLNMAALQDMNILAVDNSIDQIRLCRIKQVAASVMDPIRAASFLGYMEMPSVNRQNIFCNEIRPLLPEEDCFFWECYPFAVQQGVINSARFEQYIRKVSVLGRSLIGKRNLSRLFDCDTVEEQKEIFDQRITGPFLKSIFEIAFHPRIYINRGIDPAGLTHSGSRNIAEFFFQRFRNFCCSTISRKNYYLQYIFFNHLLFREALPEFLQPSLHENFVKNQSRIEYKCTSFDEALQDTAPGLFNKIHLSNIGDWMSKESMSDLFSLIRDKTLPGSRAVMRYIHMNHKVPASVPELVADYDLGEDLIMSDRFPFYSIVPVIRI
jgi:S-adenosylmethionine-diacylglycerol 3-amino-3-carboxypropyl transferase